MGADHDALGVASGGAAYVFDLDSANPSTPIASLRNPSSTPSGDLFGSKVAISGSRIVVGAYFDGFGATGAGRAYVFDLASETPTLPIATLNNPSPEPYDSFGASVGISGSRVVIGAHRDNTGAGGAGSAYVYDLDGADPTVPIETLNNPTPAGGDFFGSNVAISGSRVVVCAWGDDESNTDAGIAYVYDFASDTPTTPVAILRNPEPDENSYFGQEVSIDGLTVAVGAPGSVFVFGPSDTVTQPPSLTTPAENSAVNGAITFDLSIPEVPLANSVRISFNGPSASVLTLAAAQEIGGPRSFALTASNLSASANVAGISGAGSLLDGAYTVTLEYQDLYGNPVASDTSTNVILDTVPPETIIESHPAPVGNRDTATIVLGSNETGVTYLCQLDGTSFQSPATVHLADLSLGEHVFSASAVDAAGNVDETPVSYSWTQTGDVLFAALVAKDDAVPGAGEDPRIPSGALFRTFGDPAINDAGAIAFLAKWKSAAGDGQGVFSGVNTQLRVKVGDPVPGAGTGSLPVNATFTMLRDPIIDDVGRVAFIARIGGAGVRKANDFALISEGAGSLAVLAREGDEAPGTGGALFGTLHDAAIDSGGTPFTATLKTNSGSPKVTSSNDFGVWWQPAASSQVQLLLREGGPGFADGETIKKIAVLKTLRGSPGHGRGLTSGDQALLQLELSTKRQAQVLATPGSLTLLAVTGGQLNGSTLPTAEWSSMNLPSGAGNELSVLGTLMSDTDGAGEQSKGVLISADGGTTWDPLARTGVVAVGFGGVAKWTSLLDPVSASNGAVAFLGVARGGGVTAANDSAIWWRPAGGSLALLARENLPAPAALAGAKWKGFSSLAMPSGPGGPVFSAYLQTGVGGVSAANDFGLYGTDSKGEIRPLLREKQPLLGKTLRSFSALKVVNGSQGVSRSLNDAGEVVARVTYTDGSQAIVRIDVP